MSPRRTRHEKIDLAEAVRVLRDEVLDTQEHGDREPPGNEVFDAILRLLSLGIAGESVPGVDLALHDAVSRRLAWGDGEEGVLADSEQVFDRLVAACTRGMRDLDDRMVVIEAATQVATSIARIVALAAVVRAARDRSATIREDMSQRQLKDVLAKQRANIVQLEKELKVDFK